MKVLLLGINASWTHSCLTLYYLRNILQEVGADSQIIELTLKQSVSEALEKICNAQPDVICLSVYIWNVEYIKQLVQDIRKLMPALIIVAGGPEISYNEATQRAINPDFLIVGPGEAAFRKLAEKGFRSDEKVISAECIALEQTPFPYLPEDKISLQGRMVYHEASRGCACRCSYCLSSRDEVLEWLPSERVCSDIDRLLALQPKVIKFVDRSFNQKKDWARAIWEYVIRLDTDIPFHFEVHPDWLETEDIALLAQAPPGRIQLEIGIQSIHPKTLQQIGRYSDWEKVKTNLELLRVKTKIPLHSDLIVGLPEENDLLIRESIDAVVATKPTELQLGFLKILPGTAMAEYAAANNYQWSATAPYAVMQTPNLSFLQIMHLEKLARLLNQFWNKADFTTVWAKANQWRQPSGCLEDLLQMVPESERQLHSMERIRRFELMSAWIEQDWQGEQQAYLQDALKWDWCRKAGESWYPAVLKGEQAVQFRKEHYQDILDWLKSEYWQQEDWNLKRFIVFSATSNEFSKEYLDGYTKAVFVSRSKDENAVVVYKKQF